MKRIQLTHGSARVEDDCSPETIKALDELSKIAYKKVDDMIEKKQTERTKIDFMLTTFAAWKGRKWQTVDEYKLAKEIMMHAFQEGLKCGAKDNSERLYSEIMEEINEHKQHIQHNGKGKYIIVVRGFRKTIDGIFGKII